eukprot:20558-Heterococcus_DN1.PRE.4
MPGRHSSKHMYECCTAQLQYGNHTLSYKLHLQVIHNGARCETADVLHVYRQIVDLYIRIAEVAAAKHRVMRCCDYCGTSCASAHSALARKLNTKGVYTASYCSDTLHV